MSLLIQYLIKRNDYRQILIKTVFYRPKPPKYFIWHKPGSEDIRAEERYRPTRRSVFPELSTSWPYTKSIYDDPIVAADRISVPGYRYLPVHREVYGYSPRPIYTHNYARSLDRYRPGESINICLLYMLFNAHIH